MSPIRGVACFGVVATLVMAGGCATTGPLEARREAQASPVRDCSQWYSELDAVIDSAGVRDAQATRVAGFPHLRVDRFSASLRDSAQLREPSLVALYDRLVDLDIDGRAHEIANLPRPQLAAVWGAQSEPDIKGALAKTRECARRLRDFDLEAPGGVAAMLEKLSVPDDYVTAYRWFGLYALTKIPFSMGVRAHERDTRAAFERKLEAPAKGNLVRLSPESRPRVSSEQVRAILGHAMQNPLRIPIPVEQDLDLLFALYAPSFEIDTAGDFDRPGALRWLWKDWPEVDSADPAVYRQASYTRYKGENLLQLVYTIWFPERPPESDHDLLAGRIDGVVFRVTLAPDGSPLVYDTIHPCGCYHMFFPAPRAVPLPAPPGEVEWALIPQNLQSVRATDRIVVRIASGTHYVERVYVDQDDSLARYALRPYDDLRSLRQMRGGTRSVFGPQGMIAGTERAERFLFWPMGIANAGAMRQWGRHATAFVGRRHFDDADLMERRFTLELR